MGRVVTLDELMTQAGPETRGARKVVFTNGCFDLVHPGHVLTLEKARSLGDLLVVGLNSDASVRRLKGPARPLIDEDERAELMASFAAVDYVVFFGEDTPRELIARLLPDFLVKGGDWGAGEIVGREEVESAGGKVVSIPVEPGYSTTSIVEKIRATQPGASMPEAK